MSTAAPQPTRYGTCWHLPDRKPTGEIIAGFSGKSVSCFSRRALDVSFHPARKLPVPCGCWSCPASPATVRPCANGCAGGDPARKAPGAPAAEPWMSGWRCSKPATPTPGWGPAARGPSPVRPDGLRGAGLLVMHHAPLSRADHHPPSPRPSFRQTRERPPAAPPMGADRVRGSRQRREPRSCDAAPAGALPER
jgi:hypothetical protein